MTIENRLRNLEKRVMPPADAPVFWISDGSGLVRCGATGETLTEEEHRRRFPSMQRFTIVIDRAWSDGEVYR